MLHLDLEVGTSIEIDGYTITVLDIQNDEVFFQIDDPSTEDQVALSGDFARIPR